MLKLSPPRRDGACPRPRLFARLDDLRTQRVVWIAAPAGSGKTTLVASYLKARRLRCLWYQVDAGDADLASFFHHLGLAVQSAAPRFRRALPRLTPEYLGDIEVFARNTFREIGRRLPTSTVLVFDNVQDVRTNDRFYDVLRAGVEELPANVCVVFISRTRPPDVFARMQVNGQLLCLDWSELKLSEDESHALAQSIARQGGIEVDAADVARLNRQCDGWTAGLILLLEGAKSRAESGGDLDLSSVQPLFDYFASEVFAHRPPEVRDFLMQTALFPGFTEDMAAQLTGLPRARAVLDDLIRQHHFTQRHQASEPVYQYHPLFLEFLRERAREAWNPAERSLRVCAAAAILEQRGQPEEAQALYLESGDAETAARVILAHAPAMAATGRLAALEASICRLPAALCEQLTWLKYWLGACRLATDLVLARTCFEEAFQAFRAAGDARGCYLAWAGVVESFVFLWGEFTQLRPWIAEFDALRRDFPEFPDRAVEEKAIYAIFTAHVFAAPEWSAIGKWAPHAERIAREGSDPSLRIMTVASLALYYPWLGELGRSEAVMQEARSLARSESATPFARLNALSMESRSALLYGETARARKVAEEATEFAASSGVHVLDRAILASLTYACAHLGDVDAAQSALERYRLLIAPGMRLEEALWFYLASFVDALQGERRRAEERAIHAVRTAEKCGVPFAVTVCGMNLARLLAEAGRLDEARKLVDERLTLARAIRSRLIECECSLVYAWIERARGDEAACLEHLRGAFELVDRHGFRAFVASNPQWLAELCEVALAHGIYVPSVQNLIRASRLLPKAGGLARESWPWPIRLRTLGAFELLVRDEPVRFATKAQKKPLELLHALVSLGGRAVPEEQLTERLWPESEGDAAHRVFDTTLHRLRKLIGCEQAVVVEAGRVTLDSRYVWVDAWAFERQIEHASEGSPELLEQAISMYRGSFLGRDGSPWILPMRERLRSMFLRSVEQLGRIHEKSARTQDAIECYRRGIEADPLAESLYCQLMLCYERLDRTGEALATYERLRAMLSSQLGIEPSVHARAIATGVTKRSRGGSARPDL